jgi:hypothetical protein
MRADGAAVGAIVSVVTAASPEWAEERLPTVAVLCRSPLRSSVIPTQMRGD